MDININIFSTTGLPAFDNVLQPIVSFATTARLLTTVLALLLGICGYRFFRITSSIISFVVFSGLGSFLFFMIGLEKSALILGLLIGIAATVLAFLFYRFGVCTSCCMIGYFIGYGLFSSVPIGITVALTLTILAVAQTKMFYIIATSIAGGVVVANMVCAYNGISTSSIAALLITIGLVLCCFILQYADNRNTGFNPDEEKSDSEDGGDGKKKYKYFKNRQ